MADGLLDEPLARRLLAVGEAAGLPLETLLRQGDDEALRPTEVAQPALLLVGVVLAEVVRGHAGLEVVAVAGHSVGEYAALVAAGALEPEVAMELVIARGRAMAAMHQGTMAAVLGLDVAAVEALCAEISTPDAPVVVANVNAPGQIVVSGAVAAVERACAVARERGARRCVPLRVSGAFHSPLMAEAAAQVAARLEAVPLRDPRVPVACNVDGRLVTDALGLRERLRRQLVSPVQWVDCVRSLVSCDIDALVELGPQGVLTGLARRIAPDVPAVALPSIEAVADYAARAAAVARG